MSSSILMLVVTSLKLSVIKNNNTIKIELDGSTISDEKLNTFAEILISYGFKSTYKEYCDDKKLLPNYVYSNAIYMKKDNYDIVISNSGNIDIKIS